MRIPLIVADPSPVADATRGTVCDALVEAIDLARATQLEAGVLIGYWDEAELAQARKEAGLE